MDIHCISIPTHERQQLQNQEASKTKPKPTIQQQRNRRLSQSQVRLLETSFTTDHKLQAERKHQLAARLGVSPRQVAIWYQNRRARHKTKTVELDYRTIQLKLENVLAHNRRLEKQVGVLKNELDKARKMLLLSSAAAGSGATSSSPVASLPSALDDHGSTISSLQDYNNYGVESAAALQVEQLYTCLSPWP